MTKILTSITEIIDLYDIFILDQWGVMHDGVKGYSHAIKAVDKLLTSDKKLIIISNSSKRKKSSINKLKSLGFNRNNFIEVMTSGEMVWQELSSSMNNYGDGLINCFHIYDKSKEDGLNFRAGLTKFNFVSNVRDSNFILACTPFHNTKPIDYISTLNDALEKNLIMFCANPDYMTVEKNNKQNIFCMGTIADLYKHMGGKVIILGKPSKEIYIESTKKIKNIDKSRIIAIGDSLDHDIFGASNFGIDSILISSGIHNEFFQKTLEIGLKKLKNSKKWDYKPTYLCSNFSI